MHWYGDVQIIQHKGNVCAPTNRVVVTITQDEFYQGVRAQNILCSNCENPRRELYVELWAAAMLLSGPNQRLQIVATISFLAVLQGCPRHVCNS